MFFAWELALTVGLLAEKISATLPPLLEVDLLQPGSAKRRQQKERVTCLEALQQPATHEVFEGLLPQRLRW